MVARVRDTDECTYLSIQTAKKRQTDNLFEFLVVQNVMKFRQESVHLVILARNRGIVEALSVDFKGADLCVDFFIM